MYGTISIIIPAYNSEKFIKRSIDSALSQTYEDIEVVVVDDGSNDNTLSICNSIAKSDPRLHIFHIYNSGPSRARNYGIAKSCGKWVMFLDSDDALEQDICERLISAANKYSAEVSFCNLSDISDSGTFNYIPLRGAERYFEGDSKKALDRMLVSKISETRDSIQCLSGPYCKIIKKDVLDGITFPEHISLGEDTCFCHEVISKAKSVVYISDVLYLRYLRPDALSGIRMDMSERLVQYTNWVFDKYYSDCYFSDAVKNLMTHNLYSVIIMYYGRQFSLNYSQASEYVNQYIENQRIRLSIVDILHSGELFKRKMLLVAYYLIAHHIVYLICRTRFKIAAILHNM